jgi:TRAP-type uncharacterized transport system substrate-binding protein
MWYYRLREYISWIIIFALLAAIVFYGYRLSTEQTLLRLGTGPQGSVTHEIGEQLKRSVERYSRYQVKLFPQAGSRKNREALLRDAIELAVVAPVAQSSPESVSSLAILGFGHSHLIVPEGSAGTSPETMAGMTFAAGPMGSDDWWLAQQFFRSAGLENAVTLASGSLAELAPGAGAFRVTHRFDSRLQALFAGGGYRLSDMSRAGALMVREPLYQWSELPAGTYPGANGMVPAASQFTLRTPITLMVRDSAPRDMVYRLMSVLDQPRTQQALAPFGFEPQLFRQDQAAIVRHAAASEYLDPQRAWGFLGDIVQWLMEYRWLTLLVLLAAILTAYRWRQSRRFRLERLQRERHHILQKLMNDVLKMEEAQRTERDWKTLEHYRRDLAALKKRGIDLAMQEGARESSAMLIFTQQCNQLADELERRLAARTRPASATDNAASTV